LLLLLILTSLVVRRVHLVMVFFEFLGALKVDFVDVSEGGVALENLLGGQFSRPLIFFIWLHGASRSEAAESRTVGYCHIRGLVVSSVFKVF
jgi:hypothetical protein